MKSDLQSLSEPGSKPTKDTIAHSLLELRDIQKKIEHAESACGKNKQQFSQILADYGEMSSDEEVMAAKKTQHLKRQLMLATTM